MIKLQDFARECGVTDRQVHRLLNKYEDEVRGHFERKGQNGTWLDDQACEILCGKMKRLPPAVVDGETARKNDELQKRVEELEARLSDKEKLVEMAQRRADQLQERAGKVYALEAGKKELEGKVNDLTAEKEKARQEADRLREENAAMSAELAKISGMGPLKRLFYKPQKGE